MRYFDCKIIWCILNSVWRHNEIDLCFPAYYGYCGIPWHSDREVVSSTLVDVVTHASGYPGTRECFHGVKMTRYCNTRRLMATDKQQSMQEPRRRLLPRDDQDSYDAMTIR